MVHRPAELHQLGKVSAVKVLTFSFESKDGDVKVKCTFADAEVFKTIPVKSKPLRLSAVLDDAGNLADIEVVVAE